MTAPPITILIVDDESQNRRLLELLLRSEGYLTVSVASGTEALALIESSPPDLILLDVMMPDMDGYQVAKRLKSKPSTSNIPIIMVTAQIDRDARLMGLEAGAEEFLTKPVDRAELSLRVRNLLRLKALGDFYRKHTQRLEQQVEERTVDLMRFRSAMDATADAIVLVNRGTMRLIEVNATACDMFGYTREEMLQMDPARLGAATLEQLRDAYDALIAGGGANEVTETQVLRKDGSALEVEAHRHAHRSGAEWTIVSVLRDITERKQAQQESLRFNAVLEERVRQRTAQLQMANQELEAFSYSVSHDLRAPLSAIDGFSAALAGDLDPQAMTERGRHYLERIRSGVVHMGDLIDALLSLAQVSRTDLSWDECDLSAMVQAVLDGYREGEPARATQFDIQPGLVAQGDSRLLRQMLDNLLGNAWKFSGQQPVTCIAVRREAGPGGEDVYAVQDNGVGFDMAYSDKLFGPFQRLHAMGEFPGTGIGLATVKRIVAHHGGRVWAESIPGQGSTFYFTLGGAPA